MANRKTNENLKKAGSPQLNEELEAENGMKAEEITPEIEQAAAEAEQVRVLNDTADTDSSRDADRRDAEAYRELMNKQREYEDSVNKVIERWRSDSERLKREVPDFELGEAMKDEEFKRLIISGMSVDGAYYAMKYRELTGARRPIMQNAYSRGTRSGSDMNDILSLDNRGFRNQIKKMMEQY